MRKLATCYSDHAVKVSDSYCSGPLNGSYVSPKSIPAVQSAVSQTFKAPIPGQDPLFATVTWCRKGFFLHVTTQNLPLNGPHHYEFGKPKGSKRVKFEQNGSVEIKAYIHWDLTSAHFESSGPEPLGSFHVIIILPESRTAVVLGDIDSDPDARDLVNGYEIQKLTLVSQYEHFSSHWSNPITTRVRFGGSGSEHEVMIKCCPEDDGPRNPVLSIWIDKRRVVRVKRLQWNFRGNQVIFVDGLLVDVMWDVFGWFFENQIQIQVGKKINNDSNNNNSNNKSGLFMFRRRSGLDSRLWLEEEEEEEDNKFGLSQNHHHFALLISANTKN